MAVYQPNGTSGIGTLLRMIKEQRSQGPIVPPAAEVGSPIRNVVQGPLETPESPETSRVISVRPETSPTSTTVAPVGPIAPSMGSPASAPVGPVANRPVPTPVPTPTPPGGFPAPSVSPVSGPVAVAKRVEGPSIGTVLGAKAPVSQARGISVQGPESYKAPYGAYGPSPEELQARGVKPGVSTGRVGVNVLDPNAPRPNPTQTPSPQQKSSWSPAPKQSGGPSIATKIVETLKKSPFQFLFGR